jgi:hypothetical protein
VRAISAQLNRDGVGRGPAAAGVITAGLAGRDYLRYPANAPTPPTPTPGS